MDRTYTYNFNCEDDLNTIKEIIIKLGGKINYEETYSEGYFYSLEFKVLKYIDIFELWTAYEKIRLRYLDENGMFDFEIL